MLYKPSRNHLKIVPFMLSFTAKAFVNAIKLVLLSARTTNVQVSPVEKAIRIQF
jgi:hypothetical protein